MDAVGGKGPRPGIDGDASGGHEEVLPVPRPSRWRWRWWVALMVAAVAGVLVVVAAHNRGGPSTATRTVPSRSAAPAPAPPTSSPSVAAVATASVTTIEVGHPLLGITADWQLLGLGPGTMLRIDFAHGRISRTTLPTLQSNGPVFFLAAPHAAIIRPLDFVPGYLVPDGQPPRMLTGAL
ncbi:MAG TPA: hypothetical protein VFU35_09005, partial [Jatrophihabitans sp.]|nr:hypothetical protein [Jatrophihabitans sp.]